MSVKTNKVPSYAKRVKLGVALLLHHVERPQAQADLISSGSGDEASPFTMVLLYYCSTLETPLSLDKICTRIFLYIYILILSILRDYARVLLPGSELL